MWKIYLKLFSASLLCQPSFAWQFDFVISQFSKQISTSNIYMIKGCNHTEIKMGNAMT
jgi:hypothetical protein